MSMMTEWHATEDAKSMNNRELLDAIIELEKAEEWKGSEFEDVRIRHKCRTRIETFKKILLERVK